MGVVMDIWLLIFWRLPWCSDRWATCSI